jgi:hypothetical protein
MSSFDMISVQSIAEDSFLDAEAPRELTLPDPMKDSDFKTHLTFILACYYDLQTSLADRSHREDTIIKAEILGEAIRAVSWTADSLKYFLAHHKQDVPHVLEAIQLVGLILQGH